MMMMLMKMIMMMMMMMMMMMVMMMMTTTKMNREYGSSPAVRAAVKTGYLMPFPGRKVTGDLNAFLVNLH